MPERVDNLFTNLPLAWRKIALWSLWRCTLPSAAKRQREHRLRDLLLCAALADRSDRLHAHCRYIKEGAGAIWTTPHAMCGAPPHQVSLFDVGADRSRFGAGVRLEARGAAGKGRSRVQAPWAHSARTAATRLVIIPVTARPAAAS